MIFHPHYPHRQVRKHGGPAALTALLAAAMFAAPAAADPLPIRFVQLLERTQRLEAVEMITAILGGSHMGPGDGWFHPGQSRYGWEWLAVRHGLDKNASLTRELFRGPSETFARLDRSRDGVLTAADFDWSERSPLQREGAIATRWARMLDTDSNGRVSRAEWDALFERVAKSKGYLTADDLREALPTSPPRPPAGSKPPAADMPTPDLLLRGLFQGELGSIFEGPAVGQRAPNFTLPTQDGKQHLSLAQYRGHKPVVLIFGNFT